MNLFVCCRFRLCSLFETYIVIFCLFAVHSHTTSLRIPLLITMEIIQMTLSHFNWLILNSPDVFLRFLPEIDALRRESRVNAGRICVCFCTAGVIHFTLSTSISQRTAHITHSFGLNRGNRLSSVDTHSRAHTHTPQSLLAFC